MCKIKILISLFFFQFLFSAQAQKGFYVGVNAGYGFSVGGSSGYNYNASYSSSGTSYTYTNNPYNYGQGVIPSVQLGYFFNQNLGIDLGIGYLLGSNHVTTYATNSSNGYTSLQTGYTYTYKLSSLYLNPSLVIKVPLGLVSPYLKTGLFFGVLNQLKENENVLNSSNSYSLTETGGITFGANAAIGIEIALSKNFSILGEVFFRYASYAPGSYTSSSTTTNYYSSGSSNSYTNTVNYSGNHLDNLSITSSTTTNTSSSSSNNIVQDRPIVMYAANAIGVSVGVKYYINPK